MYKESTTYAILCSWMKYKLLYAVIILYALCMYINQEKLKQLKLGEVLDIQDQLDVLEQEVEGAIQNVSHGMS